MIPVLLDIAKNGGGSDAGARVGAAKLLLEATHADKRALRLGTFNDKWTYGDEQRCLGYGAPSLADVESFYDWLLGRFDGDRDKLLGWLQAELVRGTAPPGGRSGYLTRKWTRLVRRGTATRLDRCETDLRWLAVQDVVFERADGLIAQRVRERSPARARLVMGVALNYAASTGAVLPIPTTSGREYVQSWSDARATAYVEHLVARVMSRAGAAAIEALLAAYGPKDAAAYLIERANAACARSSRVSDALLERSAIQDEGAA